MNQAQLPNGLRILHEPSDSPVIYCGYAIDVGTRDEYPDEQGMAHFVDHLVFKGTQRRTAAQNLNGPDSMGGDLNAFTTKENTFVHATVMRRQFARTVDLLTDIVFRSTCPDAEIAKDAEIEIDEILSYEDSPSELIFDEFEDLLFSGHPLGHAILGRPEQLRTFTSDKIRAFVARNYTPANMVFFVRSNLPFRQIVHTVQKYTDDIPARTSIRQRICPSCADGFDGVRLQRQKQTHQAHVVFGGRSYAATDDKYLALYLLNNLLGGPALNSRLNALLRERTALVYSVESSLTAYTDCGWYGIYFGTDGSDVERCLKIVARELQRLRDKLLTPTQFLRAQHQLIGQLAIASEQYESRTLSIAKRYLHYGIVETPQAWSERIAALSAASLLEVANEVFDVARGRLLIYQSK
jgi:predicted Zn-dependent peptidase